MKQRGRSEWGSTPLVLMEEAGDHHGRTWLKTYCTGVEEENAKITVEQSSVLWAPQHCLPSSFLNILLEYSSTLIQRHPPRKRGINRALYHPDTQQCISPFVIVVTWISSIINRLHPSTPLVCLYFMFTVDSDHILLRKGIKEWRGRAVCSGFQAMSHNVVWKELWAPEPDHWHEPHNHAHTRVGP